MSRAKSPGIGFPSKLPTHTHSTHSPITPHAHASRNPCDVNASGATKRSHVLLWHANYHPDGGQLFFPLNGEAFICPLALPGDDVKPEDFVAFYVDGGKGLYIHPNIWHEAVFPLAERASFYDEQGKVHARVSCNIAIEFGVFLSVPLAAPK